MLNLEEEIRCEFRVTKARKMLWKSELDMITWLDSICEKYSINYFLIGGSEIGAVRHKGFIPWDDDIDLGMLRTDFDVFMKVYRDELPEWYEVQHGLMDNDHCFSNLCRIRDSRTTGIIDNQIGLKISHGAFIEIYPYDNIPDSEKAQRKHALKANRLLSIIYHKTGQKKACGIRNKLWSYVYRKNSLYEMEQMLDAHCRKYQGVETEYVSTVIVPQYYISRSEILLKKDVRNSIVVPFEDRTVRIPTGFDRCLSKQYGNYMQLPPIEKRGEHHAVKVFYDPVKPYTVYLGKTIVELVAEYGQII